MVEVAECFLTNIRDIPGNFLRAEFRIAGCDVEFRDVDGGVNIVFNYALGDDDGILEVVAVPRHESYENVTTDSEFAVFRVRTVCKDSAFLDLLADLDDGLLIDAGACVGTHELTERVCEDALREVGLHGLRLTQELLVRNGKLTICGGDDDFSGSCGNDAVGFGNDHGAGVAGGLAFEAGSNQWRLGNEKRHTLALHVRSHECAVGVIVLEERDQTRSHGDELLRGNVHVMHRIRGGFVQTHSDQSVFTLERTMQTPDGERRERIHVGVYVDDLAVVYSHDDKHSLLLRRRPCRRFRP